jgi:hypothetical protein
METLTYDVDGRIARITLNRPERGNGIRAATPGELAECVERGPSTTHASATRRPASGACRATRPATGSAQSSNLPANSPNTAPWASWATRMRPPGTSIGGTITCPPSSPMRRASLSTSSLPK